MFGRGNYMRKNKDLTCFMSGLDEKKQSVLGKQNHLARNGRSPSKLHRFGGLFQWEGAVEEYLKLA
jgi:hypothetical protein